MRAYYDSPIGRITLESDGKYLTALRFDCTFAETEGDCNVFSQTKRWLDVYFSGRCPDFTPPLAPDGTQYRKAVWKALCEIPFGQTVTYTYIAEKVAAAQGKTSFSARAAGGAIGANPIAIIIPCHRVIGADGSLTGFAYGIERKKYLLELEK